MTNSGNNRKKFSVVQFIALPYEGIDDYVCVPDNWIVLRKPKVQKVAVAYPKDEDRFVTRDRVKREERKGDDWKFWTAELKYQSDSFEDAEFWIATRNDYGPLVQQSSSIDDTPSTSTLNKKLRSSKQKSTSKSKTDTPEMTANPYQIARKPSPKTTIKRPGSGESEPQLDSKRSKQSTKKADESTGAVTQNANTEPECSSMPITLEGGPEIIDIDEINSQQDQQPSENNDDSQNHLVNNITAAQNHLQDGRNSPSNFQPQIQSVQSLATTSNNQEPRADDSSSNGPSTSQHTPISQSIADRLYAKMKGKPSLVAKHPAVEKKMRLENITRNVAIALENPSNLMNQNQPRRGPITIPMRKASRIDQFGDIPISSREIRPVARINIERTNNASAVNPRVVLQNVASVVSTSPNLSSSPQQRPNFVRQLDRQQNSLAPDQHMQQATRGQDLPQRLTEAQRRDPRLRSERRPISAAIDTEHQLIGRSTPNFNPTIRTNGFHQSIDAPYQMQRTLNQQVTHMPQSSGRRLVEPPVFPRSMRSTPPPQRAIRKPPSPVFTNLPDSIQRTLLATRRKFLSREEFLQGHLAQGTPIIVTHPDAMDYAASVDGNVYQRNQVYLQNDIVRSPSASDSEVGMDHDAISDHELPADEAVVETTNNINRFQHDSANIPQNIVSRSVSEREMKNQFASISTQMGSTLNYMVNVFENLRTSILEAAVSYQTLLDNMERFNSPENSTNQSSLSRNVTQEVPLVTEEREITATERVNSNGERDSNDFNEAPERNPNPTWRLTLPPEYDPDDTRWTLKHQEHMPGLVELMPHRNVYVNYGELKYCEEISTDCPSLARRIVVLVFSKNALSVCSSMTEKGHVDNDIVPNERPKLDEHGCLVLLNYILEQGFERGWKTDMQPILKVLHDKVEEMRFKFGVISRC